LKRDGTEKIRARYDRISPYYDLMELVLEKVVFSRWRRKVFDSLDGDTILEVGVETGKNVDFYPASKPIAAIDFSPGMLSRARRKAEEKGLNVDLVDWTFRISSMTINPSIRLWPPSSSAPYRTR